MTRIAVCIVVVLAFAWACVEFGKDLSKANGTRHASLNPKPMPKHSNRLREIAKLETSAQVIKERVIRETVDRPVYRDCAHSDSVLHDINAAITGQSVDPSELPASGPSD